MIRTDLGIATAYAEAVSKGYTGTRDEFGQMFVDFGKTAEKVTEDKKAVEQMKASVEETKNSVDTTAAEFGQNVADKTEEAKSAITEHANTEKASATEAIAAVKDSAAAEITKKGTDTLATIPEDYTSLNGQVSQLKEDLGDVREVKYSRNLFDVSKFLKDKEILSNGAIIDSTNNVGITDFIDVSNKKLVYFSKNGSSLPQYNLYFISEFDSKKNAIKRITAADANYIYTPSDNARYIRCCVKNSIIDSLQIEYDEITPFTLYKKYIVIKGSNIDDMSSAIEKNKKTIDGVISIEVSKNKFNISTAKDDTAYKADGEYYAKGYMLTDFIPVETGRTIFSSVDGIAKQINFVYTFSDSKAFIASYTYNDTFDITENVAFIRICIYGNTTNLAKLQIEYDEITPFTPYGLRKTIITGDNITEMESNINEIKEKGGSIYDLLDNPLSRINDSPELLSCFFNVGCIGDSLASGVAVYKNSQGETVVNSENRYNYSWGKYLERMTGNTYYNWSAGGLRTDTWLSSSYATECFDGKHLCQAYIIGLGQNDNNKSQGSDIGTSADIDLADYKNNAESFYGRYAKIIQKIKEVQPKAKIFVVTDPNDSVDANGYNVAIRKMAELFKFVYVLDMRKYWNDAPCKILLNNQKRYGHFNAVGYYLIAKMMMTYIDWIMQKHWEDFREIENIGTDWYYYDELK